MYKAERQDNPKKKKNKIVAKRQSELNIPKKKSGPSLEEKIKTYQKKKAAETAAEKKAREALLAKAKAKAAEQASNRKKYPGWDGDKPVKYKPRKKK